MSKKAQVLLIIALFAIMQPAMPNFPAISVVCMLFSLNEFISVLENASRCGVPLPGAVAEALVKAREITRAKNAEVIPPPMVIKEKETIMYERPRADKREGDAENYVKGEPTPQIATTVTPPKAEEEVNI